MQTASGLSYKYDILKYQSIFLAISVAFFAVGIIAYIVRGGFNYHIEFTGGAEVRIMFNTPIDIGVVRNAMSTSGWKDIPIQSIGRENKEFIMRIRSLDEDTEQQIKNALKEQIASNQATITNITWVGAEVGKDTKWNAFLAIMLSLIVLLLYIAVRFEFRFGVGAVVALAHDLLSLLVFLLLTNEPVSLHVLASILTVLGYSINDTIVIFSRIRDNMAKMPLASEVDVANLSINQTLTRTLLTSFSTVLSVTAILVLGGEALRGLSLVLLLGIIVGTYSSVYIASPVMLAVGKMFRR